MLHLLLLVHLLHELLLLLLVGVYHLLLLMRMGVLRVLDVLLLLSQNSSLILGHTTAATVHALVLLLGVDRFKKGLPGAIAIGTH